MRIVVCVKQTYDPATVKISRSREEFDLRGAVKIMNPADKHALEAALRLREAAGGEVVALTVGDADAEDVGREAIAMGADRALLIAGPELAAATGRAVAKALAAGIGHLAPVDLVLVGQAAAVDGTGGLAPRLAAALGWPVALDVLPSLSPSSSPSPNLGGGVGVGAEVGAVEAVAVVDPGVGEAISLPLPAVVAIVAGAERPRYPQPARIANAWAPGLLAICTASDLGLTAEDLAPDVEVGGLVLPPERTRGQVITGPLDAAVDELWTVLQAQRLIPAAAA